MAGQPVPPRFVEAFAINAPSCTQAAPVAGGKTDPFPAPSQIGTLNGAASLEDGFPPLTMTPPSSNGVPPFGIDVNGAFYLMSAWIVAMAAGQYPQFDATLAAAMGGYKAGAVVQQTGNLNGFWINTTDGNVNDPDTGGANWISTVPLHETLTAAAGTTHNQVLANGSDQVLDIDTTAGAATFDGFVAQRDGQRLTVCNNGANPLSIAFLTGSAAANQIRANGANITILTDDAVTIQYCNAISKWVIA